MTNAILVCGPTQQSLDGYQIVAAVCVTRRKALEARGAAAVALTDYVMADRDVAVRRLFQTALLAEAGRGGAVRWAPLAYQHLIFRYLRYCHFRERLARLIGENGISALHVTSGDDLDLAHAARAACAVAGVDLTFGAEATDPFSSLLSFLASYDLPVALGPLENLCAAGLALMYRARGTRIFFQSYHNLGRGLARSAPLTWRRTICCPGRGLLPTPDSGGPRSLIDPRAVLTGNAPPALDPACWPGLDAFDMAVLNSAWDYFARRYDPAAIDGLHAAAKRFFRLAGTERLVLNSDNTATCRLLSHAARQVGIQVDYLPHGLIWQDSSLDCDDPFVPTRALCWNPSQAAAFARRGHASATVAHPVNAGPVVTKKRLPADLSRLNVIMLLPEWLNLSFAARMDCFENDLYEVAQALSGLGVRDFCVKFHHSGPDFVAVKTRALEDARPHAAIPFTILPSHQPSSTLIDHYDLAIIGPTTGILEAARSPTPFIAYGANIAKTGLFDGFDLPRADNPRQLADLIRAYPQDGIDAFCRELDATFKAGLDPFGPELSARA